MTKNQILKAFENINVWTRGDERAPHKPLLILYALGKCHRGEDRLISYKEIDKGLRPLLIEYGPVRRSYHTEYPFWRLQHDGIWEVPNSQHLIRRRSHPDKGHADAKKSELLKYDISGGFQETIYDSLRKDKRLIGEVTNIILQNNFPETMHQDILDEVGLEIGSPTQDDPKRDSEFRSRVIRAYEHRCAICGYDVRMGASSLGLDAAHIKWHQARGPHTEDNGLALCVLHHKIFDRGAITVSNDYQILVSQEVHGSNGLNEWLLRFHCKKMNMPQSPAFAPKKDYLDWHFREVFKKPARH